MAIRRFAMMLSDELVAKDSLQLIQVLVREAHGDHLVNLEWITSKKPLTVEARKCAGRTASLILQACGHEWRVGRNYT
jgi:hypothetical protein